MNNSASTTNTQEKPKNLRERIANNVIIILAAVAITSFGVGWTAHERVTAAGGWALITEHEKQEYNRLRTDAEKMKARVADLESQLAALTTNEVRILSPTEGASVEWTTLVEGQISGALETHEHLWLVVHPANSRGWYPQNSEFFPNTDGSWEAAVTIGRENQDRGKQHDIAVVLAPNDANNAFNDYLARGNDTGDFPEEPLPDDIRMLAKVTVVRQ